MNRYQFISLDEGRQLKMLKIKGRILHRRLRRKYTVSLYRMENFYIEVWENSIKNGLENLVTYKDRTLLAYPFNMDEGRQNLNRA